MCIRGYSGNRVSNSDLVRTQKVIPIGGIQWDRAGILLVCEVSEDYWNEQ